MVHVRGEGRGLPFRLEEDEGLAGSADDDRVMVVKAGCVMCLLSCRVVGMSTGREASFGQQSLKEGVLYCRVGNSDAKTSVNV